MYLLTYIYTYIIHTYIIHTYYIHHAYIHTQHIHTDIHTVHTYRHTYMPRRWMQTNSKTWRNVLYIDTLYISREHDPKRESGDYMTLSGYPSRCGSACLCQCTYLTRAQSPMLAAENPLWRRRGNSPATSAIRYSPQRTRARTGRTGAAPHRTSTSARSGCRFPPTYGRVRGRSPSARTLRSSCPHAGRMCSPRASDGAELAKNKNAGDDG